MYDTPPFTTDFQVPVMNRPSNRSLRDMVLRWCNGHQRLYYICMVPPPPQYFKESWMDGQERVGGGGGGGRGRGGGERM